VTAPAPLAEVGDSRASHVTRGSGLALAGAGAAAAPVPLSEIQAPVREGLEDVRKELWRIVDDESPLIGNVNGYLMGMKGKLFRPTLVLLSNAVAGRPAPTATTLAAVLELMHVATLVHDDAVDHSALRRGMPTLNALFNHQVSVIAGDFLYLRALRELARLGDLDSLRVLTDATVQMTRGELLQLAAGDPLSCTESDYNALISAKTGSLFGAACALGALCGAPEFGPALTRYGDQLGMAFQIVDDLLDYTADHEVTGKPGGLDLRERKMTLPLIAAMREMGSAPRARVTAFFTADAPVDEDIHEVIALATEYGGLDYARRQSVFFGEQAAEALVDMPDTPARGALFRAISYVLERRS
jgi:octaprenyl-diphosphate synthase